MKAPLGRAALAAPFQKLTRMQQGILWMVLATFVLSCMAGLVKHLAGRIHPLEVLFFRAAFGFLWMVPFMLRVGLDGLKTERRILPIYLGRAAVGVIGGACGFWAFTLIPLAEATAIIFSRPILSTVIAILILGEIVGYRRWAAIMFGFAGVLIMVRPGAAPIGLGVYLALAAALAAACAAIFGRILARIEPPDRMTVYFMLFQMPLAAVLAALVWVTPNWTELGLLVFVGGLGAIGQRAISRAFAAGEVSVILPFDYLRFPFAAAIGFVVFGDVPLIWTWIGGTVIFLSAFYIARREAPGKAAPKTEST